MSLLKDLGLAIGMAGIIIAPIIILGGLAAGGLAVYQHTRKRVA